MEILTKEIHISLSQNLILFLFCIICLQIAAMFKIGNSKELPFIPNSLSSDGKDFIRKCLRRDPSNRPTATELLKHPFVRNAAPLERAPLCADQLESTGDLNMADKVASFYSLSRDYESFDWCLVDQIYHIWSD